MPVINQKTENDGDRRVAVFVWAVGPELACQHAPTPVCILFLILNGRSLVSFGPIRLIPNKNWLNGGRQHTLAIQLKSLDGNDILKSDRQVQIAIGSRQNKVLGRVRNRSNSR